MARLLRLEFAGACYHVINRGNYRRDVFADEKARAAFEATLFEAATRFDWRLHAFVIMRNHFHLALETPDPNLSAGMRWLQATWAARFNRFRGERGHLFQGRFRAQHVERGHALAQVAHYIHLNPVRARVVGADELPRFRWSSLHHYSRRDRPDCLEPAVVLRESGGLGDTPRGWALYAEYLAALQAELPAERQRRFGQLARGWCVGSEDFRRELRADLQQRGAALADGRLAGVEPEQWQQVREEAWRDRLERAAAKLGYDLRKLPAEKSAPEKVLLAAALRQTSGVSNAWLAAELGMGKPASVSQFVRRFRLAGGCNTTRFKRVLSNFTH